jgi:hypothetical protein
MPSSSSFDTEGQFEKKLLRKNGGGTVERRVCDWCEEDYSLNTSNSVLLGHLRRCNKYAGPPLPPISQSSSSFSSSSSSKKRKSTQLTLDSSCLTITNDALRPALAALFARCSWPHHAIDFPEFVHLVDIIRSSTCPLPTRKLLRRDQLQLAQDLRGRVVRQLRNHCRASPITIAIDGWTNVNHNKVTNVIILCGGTAYYWCSIVNSRDHNTALWTSDAVVKVLNGIKAEGLLFAGLVTDNEQVNKTLWGLLVRAFPFLIRSSCASHLVQLCVIHALELPLIDPLFKSMEALLRKFRFKEARLKLKNLQIANPIRCTSANEPIVYALLKPQDTRWSSWLYAAERLVMVKSYVDMVYSQEIGFWNTLNELIKFLKPFQVATDVLQQDVSTTYDVYRQFKKLLLHVRAIDSTNPFHASKDAILGVIINLWEEHVNLDSIVICAQLSFDKNVDVIFPNNIQSARRWFLDFAAKYAVFWQLSPSTESAHVEADALAEWSAFLGRTPGSCFDHMDTDINTLSNVYKEPQRLARAVWNLYLLDAPIISHAAVAILSVSASEASVERTFSAQGLVHSDLRNRLADATVEAELFIKFNHRTVINAEQRASKKQRAKIVTPMVETGCAEMGDDDEEDEEVLPSIAGVFVRPVAVQAAVAGAGAAAQDEREEKEEKEDELLPAIVSQVPRRPAEDDVQAFIEWAVNEFAVTPRFRWSGVREQRLEAAGQQWKPPMKDTVSVLIDKIKVYVSAQEIDES